MDLTVRLARPEELDAIWALVQRAVARMHERGNDQWGDQYPDRIDFAEDIEQGELWCVADESDAVLGVAAIICRHEPDYEDVPFRKPEPALSMHRVAVDPAREGRGVGSALFEQFERLGRERGVEALRIDTYDLNERMQALIRRHGFDYVGDTHYPRRPLPYHCFEKLLEEGSQMNRLLIVVDYQNDFVSGSLSFPGAEKLAGPIAERIREYRANGDDVIFTYDTHGPDYPDTQEGRRLPVPHCIRDTDGWALYGAVAEAARDEDKSFRKPTFPSLDLGKWLEGQAYAQVELCGLVSNICVLSNAVMAKAALPEAEIIVDANLTASNDPVLHEKALDVLEGIQVTVLNRKEDRA